MYTSEGGGARLPERVAATAAVLAGVLVAAACSDPTALRTPPELDALRVYMILDPDTALQHAYVMPAATEGVLHGLEGELLSDGRVAASAAAPDAWDDDELRPCITRYGILGVIGGQPRCLSFRLDPAFGRTYRFRASADGWPTVDAVATVPGEFEVLEATAPGGPPGTEGLEARWTRSDGAYRYIVALRPEVAPWCADSPVGRCGVSVLRPRGWLTATEDTVLSTVVAGPGADENAGGKGPWHLDVYAVDRAIYEYLTTGTSSELFPVPPVQNVEGGYGAVGAWVHRSYRLEP